MSGREDGIGFTFDMRLDLQHAAGWEAEQMAALLRGVADVLAAAGKLARAGSPVDPETRTPQPRPPSTSSPTPPGKTTDPR